ncbi:Poly-gamma-glutamate synthase subunit PgsB/CapB [Actinokineospora spheciospongiae]|uniref:Poly-gamma-glutamate synthase subunit PgsB/CapB n=1 Tax=Actinokineospora spheciospongiae TaxID=909613 RepID=W7IWQ4_9PSEU|nr:poly-gamma-glutamate synthase PgsB [Actinokineospora spheciospongiae]EWC60896.1 Poly-gamma-glutamate synthase subunit PgsB/CapB [Actinokineospora spheciospongiae]PWW60343.1 poly-gamma-glutamate synthase PgsB/CapB [Actinokineospora spheciospongiae]
MLFLYVVFALGCAAVLVAGVVEQRKHDANLDRIPHRVLVNGIRGKSSITRLCAGALRGGGLVTAAKTTGTAARFIHPDGSEEPVYRKFGIANVIEQVGIVRRASAYHPDVLVVECMAVMPDLQEINQRKLIRSTIGVLCNVREDHLAEMGPTLDDVARSLSRSMPHGGVCVTAERERLPILRAEADKRGCELIAVDPESVTDEEMSGFGWITFKENVAIALEVARLLGVNRRLALQGMWSAPPDPGVLTVSRHRADDKLLRVANVFAANDPESTLMNVERLLAQRAIRRPIHLVINCRPDRVERNGQMGALVPRVDPERIVLIGEPTRSARATIPPEWHHVITDLGTAPADEVLAGILAEVDDHASLVAVGNIHGSGELLLGVLSDLPTADDEEEPPAREVRPDPDEPPTELMPPVPAPGTARRPPARPGPRPTRPSQAHPYSAPTRTWSPDPERPGGAQPANRPSPAPGSPRAGAGTRDPGAPRPGTDSRGRPPETTRSDPTRSGATRARPARPAADSDPGPTTRRARPEPRHTSTAQPRSAQPDPTRAGLPGATPRRPPPGRSTRDQAEPRARRPGPTPPRPESPGPEPTPPRPAARRPEAGRPEGADPRRTGAGTPKPERTNPPRPSKSTSDHNATRPPATGPHQTRRTP